MNTGNVLIISDLFLAVLTVLILHINGASGWPFSSVLLKLFPFYIIAVFSSYMTEVYNQEKHTRIIEHLLRILAAGVMAFILLSSFFHSMVPSLKPNGMSISALVGLFMALQFSFHSILLFFVKSPGNLRRVAILGTGPLAQKMAAVVSTGYGHILLGYVKPDNEDTDIAPELIIGKSSEILELIKKDQVHKLVVALKEQRGKLPGQEILHCKFCGIKVLDAPTFYEELTGKLLIENIRPSWFFFNDSFNITFSKKFCKRVLDLICSIIGLIIALPLIPLIVLLVKADSRGPVFFRQVRVGEMGRHFVLYKFRTMVQDAEKAGAIWAKKDDPRVTRVGGFLRKSRLDEIPQLFNILKGDMSIIGPRPERPEFIEGLSKVIPFYSERHFIKPGLTGWAQIRYPYGASVEDAIEKLRYDLYYIKNFSFYLDAIILLETIKVMLFQRGGR